MFLANSPLIRLEARVADVSRTNLIISVQQILQLAGSQAPLDFHTKLATKSNCRFTAIEDIDELIQWVCATPSNLFVKDSFAQDRALSTHRSFLVNLIDLAGFRCSIFVKQKLLAYVHSISGDTKPEALGSTEPG